MWGIGILCLFLWLLLQLLAIDVVPAVEATSATTVQQQIKDDPIRLLLSFRKESLENVQSTVHVFSQVELLNMDETEPIVIHSVERTDEEVTNRLTKEKVQKGVLPDQIRISNLSEVTLGPRQAAIVPISFLPRFPEDLQTFESFMSMTTSTSTLESGGSSADRTRRNNLDYQANVVKDEYLINTVILLDTSRGVFQMPIEASTARYNDYRLPDVFYFPTSNSKTLSDGSSPTTTMMMKMEESTHNNGDDATTTTTLTMTAMTTAANVETVTDEQEHDGNCFDLHLSNPSKEKSLQIFDVISSQPDLLKVTMNDRDVPDMALTELFRNWDGDGWQRSIAPGVTDEYLITLCSTQRGEAVPKKEEEPSRNNEGLPRTLDGGLGYLQVRTDSNILVVSLEQRPPGAHDDGNDVVIGDSNVLVNNVIVTDATSILSESAAECQCEEEQSDVEHYPKKIQAVPKHLAMNTTDATHMDIPLVPYVSPTFVKNIELRNTSPYSINVIRTSLTLHFEDDPFLMELAQEVGLKIDAQLGKRDASVVSSDPALMDDIVVLTCSVQSSSSLLDRDKALSFSGIVHISAETAEGDEPAQLVMVFPFVIHVMDRQVYVVVDPASPTQPPSLWKHETTAWEEIKTLSGLFYPMNRSVRRSRQGRGSNKRTDDVISYRLGIASPLNRPLSLAKIDVVETDEEKANDKNSVCRRFTLSSFDAIEPPSQVGNSSFFYLGKVTLDYRFGREPRKKLASNEGNEERIGVGNGTVLPEICNLQVIVDSMDGAKLLMPLVVFSGDLDVTSSKYDTAWHSKGKEFSDKALMAPSTVTGFDAIVKLLRPSAIWSALDRVLLSLFGDQASDSKLMLALYLLGLSTNLGSINRSLRPILLNAGSVVHDEVQTFPMYLSNHNPVPITVYTDVGKVEGMSITLAREYSPGRGDGNGLMDRLPKEGGVKSEKIAKGRWKGHSRRGLHNFLLKSSGFPQAISSSLQYRDDVSLSPAAAEIHPIMQSLYTKNDVGYFHSEPVPPYVRSSEASGCPGLDMNPPLYSENELYVNDTYPMILSDNLSISRRLSVCHDAAAHENNPVLIPPGGVARFEVNLRCPSRRVLDSDITHFLSTGLVLSTDYGQFLPILANFEALLGHLQISTVDSFDASFMSNASCEEAVIDVSAGLFLSPGFDGVFITDSQHQMSEASRVARSHETVLKDKNERVPLFVTSSFTREVAISNMGSCNPWFNVSLLSYGTKRKKRKLDTGEKMEIGTVGSTIPCRPFEYNGGSDEFRLDLPDELPRYPSFYECALDWLQKRYKLQPRGCGLSRNVTEGFADDDNAADETVSALATEALRKIVHYSLVRFNDGYPRSLEPRPSPGSVLPALTLRESSYIPRGVVDLFAQLNSAWTLVTRSGLNVLSAYLRAQIDYSRENSTDSEDQEVNSFVERKTPTLSVEMSEVAIRTSLEIPTLIDQNRSQCLTTMNVDGSELPVLQFPLTRLADVSAMTVPLRNPTPVPVRVRLVAFANSYQGDLDNTYDEIGFNFVPSDVRDGYLDRFGSVYVQNDKLQDQPSRGDAQHWWEGGGAFVLPDDRGDLIQARHNLSITAGPGAKISLLNPSLHTFNGFTMGCGARCGIREDTGQGTNAMVEQQHQASMKQYSPIGASSASGMTLLGRPHFLNSQFKRDDQFVAAGGSAPADPAHIAFAIPYSSLGEIVLPPFGTGELGPVLFRPPGRHTVLGCGAAVESQGDHSDASFPRLCKSDAFESLVFLDNSLTGLERLILRGRGAWESVVFLDPDPSEASPFGDVEYRYGRSALIFPGSAVPSSSRRSSQADPVRKEVVVHNDGDVQVSFDSVYFSRSPHFRLGSPILPRSLEWKGRRKGKELHSTTEVERGCQRRGFRLIGCSESENSEFEFAGRRNLAKGFVLDPGHNISLFVEHTPDCAFNTEYVTLNLEYRGEIDNRTSWSTGLSSSRHGAVPSKEDKAKVRKLELLVGFEMSVDEMASCVPVGVAQRQNEGDTVLFLHSASFDLNTTTSLERRKFLSSRWSFSAVRIVLLCASALIAACVWKQQVLRDAACLFFQSSLLGGADFTSTSSGVPPQPAESDWSAAFRCLARADPLPSELQALGRDQARQLVLDRYKSMGAITPQCISTAGVLVRDRSGIISSGGRGSGAINGSERRARTLSDAMFMGAFTDQGAASGVDHLLPCSLGWRAAGSKGLVKRLSFSSKSRDILVRRNATMRDGRESSPKEAVMSEESERIGAREPEIVNEVVPQANNLNDDNKGDVVSTSESEGTTGTLREPENPLEEDFSGFAKVSSQKGKNIPRDKKKKKQQEANIPSPSSLERRRMTRSQKEANVNVSNEAVSKQRVEPRAKPNHVASPQTQAQRAVDVASGLQTQATRLAQQKIKAVTKKDIAKPKAKKSKAPAAVPPPPIDERTVGVVSSPVAMRSLSSTCSSAHSSPSSVGQTSVSSRSTTRSDDRTSEHGKRGGMRPPPGLAPPPGFATAGNEMETIEGVGSNDGFLAPVVPNLTKQNEKPSLSLGGAAGTTDFPSRVGSSVSSSGAESHMGTPLIPSERRAPSAASSSPLLQSQSTPLTSADRNNEYDFNTGFDVMDFLDNILGEPNTTEEGSGIGDLLAEKTSNASSIAAMPVSVDPWATERKSRAAAYGIHVEDDENVAGGDGGGTENIVYNMLTSSSVSTSHNHTNGEGVRSRIVGAGGGISGSLHNTVPLLTPSAMLAANKMVSKEGGTNGRDYEEEMSSSAAPLFRSSRGSFYSSLLNDK